MASVRWREDRSTWEVTWKELRVTQTADGIAVRKWAARRRPVPDKRTGDALAREIETKAALGQAWQDPRENPVATVGALAEAFIRAARAARPIATANYRASTLQRFLDWAGADRPVGDLTTGLLADYGAHLQEEGIATASRYVALVEQLWAWAHDRGDTYAGVPTPRKITGKDRDLPHSARPVAVDTPTWADVDAMLHALTPAGAPKGGRGVGYRPQWATYFRIALVQRYTGLRISQIVSLDWSDLDLDRLWLTLRAANAGAKGQSRDRVVPLHPALAREMAGWGLRDGLVFHRMATKGQRKGERTPIPGNEVAEIMVGSDHKDHRKGERVHTAGAWERAGVDVAKWGAVGRDHTRATNAIRAAFKSAIAGAASYDLAKLMLGQSASPEHDAYVAMGNPTASPYWSRMVKALESIPPVDARPLAGGVVLLEEMSELSLRGRVGP